MSARVHRQTDRSSAGEMEGDVTPPNLAPPGRQNTTPPPTRSHAPDRQAVQVIQQAAGRPQAVAAQYLQQMYAAQQQHLMLQTAALQQQRSVSANRQSPSPKDGVPSSLGAAQASMNALPSPPVTPQLIGRAQGTSDVTGGGAISQQAVLLGNSAPACSQAQVYLRTQMLILTPAATVAPVQSDLPVSPSSSSAQVESLALCAGHVGAPPVTHHSIQPKAPPPLLKMPSGPSKTNPEDLRDDGRVKHPPHCTSGHKVAPHQLIIPQPRGTHKQVQHIALRVTTQETPPSHPCFTLPPLTPPGLATVQSQHSPAPTPPPVLVSTQPSAATLHHLPLHSKEELPVAETLVQMPFQNLPPPQTVAVDLKVQPTAPQPLYELEGSSVPGEDDLTCPQRNGTPTPPTLSPLPGAERDCANGTSHMDDCSAVAGFPCTSLMGNASVICSSEDRPYANTSPPPLLPAVVRSASLPGGPESQPPQAIVRPHILTHLIEGFVIQEGLEPFPQVGRSSLMVQQQATLPGAQDTKANGEHCAGEDLMEEEQQENSTDSDMDDGGDNGVPADEGADQVLTDVLQCEFCGKRGYAHTFLRSKRFCSITCVKRFNVSCTKRHVPMKTDRSGRWLYRPEGRRGRPPRRKGADTREHLRREMSSSYGDLADVRPSQRPAEEDDEEDEEEPAIPMTTRHRRQAQRDSQRGPNGRRRVAEAAQGLLFQHPDTASWTVDDVSSFIYGLPGCQGIAEEFRSQEIDGQALLLLSEDHLMGTMNIKLGPALKICAHINSLKGP